MCLYKNLQSGFADGMSERSEGIPDSEGIELTRTAGSKAKLPERGANPRGRIFGRALARKVSVGRYSVDTPNNPRGRI